jgi:hypothetical protein
MKNESRKTTYSVIVLALSCCAFIGSFVSRQNAPEFQNYEIVNAKFLADLNMLRWTANWDPTLKVSINSGLLMDEMETLFSGCHFRLKIVQGRVFYKTLKPLGKLAWYKQFRMNKTLEMISNAIEGVQFPNHHIDLFISTCDHSRSGDSTWTGALSGYPLFATKYNRATLDIAYPDPLDLHESYFPTYEDTPFDQKIGKAAFRGSTTNYELHHGNWEFSPRFKIAQLSRDHPDLLDAGITRWSHAEHTNRSKVLESMNVILASRMNATEQSKFKYLLDIAGGLGSGRTCWILSSSSLLIRSKSYFHQFYWPLLKPGEHYIEVDRSYHDLISTIVDLNSKPEYVKKVIANANKVAERFCNENGRTEYWREILLNYANLIVNASTSSLVEFSKKVKRMNQNQTLENQWIYFK